MNPYSESQKPEFCPVKNTNTIVIFIHGIVEGPAQFKDLMKLTIQHGYSAVSLLLPGHGGTGKDFARSYINNNMTRLSSSATLWEHYFLLSPMQKIPGK